MYRGIFSSLLSGPKTDGEVMQDLKKIPSLKNLDAIDVEDEGPPRKRFSKTVQAAAVIRDILANRSRCPECGARLPPFSRSKDHVKLQDDGGLGTVDNLQFTHPYCNSGHKQRRLDREAKEHPLDDSLMALAEDGFATEED